MATVRTVERRRKVLVDRDFQLRFVCRLAGALFFYLLLFLLVAVVAPAAFTLLGESPEWAVMETTFRVEVLLRVILAPLLCTFLCLFAHGILETFRIAGPNYRFQQVFHSLESRCIPRGVRIRKRDYMQETARAFDQALVTLHDDLASLQREGRQAVEALEAIATPGADPRYARALEAARRVDESLSRFELVTVAPECRPVSLGSGGEGLEAAGVVEPVPETVRS